MRIRTLIMAGATAAAASFSSPAAIAATELNLVYPFPDFLIYTKMCKSLVGEINKSGAVKINILPFNSIGMFKQPPAIKAGRVDIACTPAAFYARGLPEAEAVATSNSSPAAVRANGGLGMLDDVHQKLMGVKYLGWTTSGARFRIYMKTAPKFTPAGLGDFTGVKLRDNPIYGAFFKAMKATTHALPATAVYSALEKGVVDAAAWATVGVQGLKWDKFLRHAVEPEFFQTDIGWIMNLKKWKSLDAKTKGVIQQAVTAREGANRATLEGMAAAERKKLMAEGMKFHVAPNLSAYYKLAVDSAYQRMTDRLKKTKRGAGIVSKLRATWQK